MWAPTNQPARKHRARPRPQATQRDAAHFFLRNCMSAAVLFSNVQLQQCQFWKQEKDDPKDWCFVCDVCCCNGVIDAAIINHYDFGYFYFLSPQDCFVSLCNFTFEHLQIRGICQRKTGHSQQRKQSQFFPWALSLVRSILVSIRHAESCPPFFSFHSLPPLSCNDDLNVLIILQFRLLSFPHSEIGFVASFLSICRYEKIVETKPPRTKNVASMSSYFFDRSFIPPCRKVCLVFFSIRVNPRGQHHFFLMCFVEINILPLNA